MSIETSGMTSVTTLVAKIHDDSIDFEFPSTTGSVDSLVPQACDFLRKKNFNEFDQFRIVLRELLINAVEHGNKNNQDRCVSCQVKPVNEQFVQITVEDEGEGFDYQTLNMAIPEDTQQVRQRGYPLINAFSEEIQFSKDSSKVSVLIRLSGKTTFTTELIDGWNIIQPSSDITAFAAEQFRVFLNDQIEQGHTRFRFDLTSVGDIDSVALSVLFVLSRTLAEKNIEPSLEIVNANKSLITLFRMIRLDRVYRIIC